MAVASAYVPHLYHQVHDWCYMLALVAVFSAPALIAKIRHRLWRRRVMSAFR